jgi:hypothetical protein
VADRVAEEEVASRRPIEEVLAEHAPRLLALQGVVGVYEGETDAGDPCLRVMVDAVTPDLRRAIPSTLEGYPVELHETGPLAPRDGG